MEVLEGFLPLCNGDLVLTGKALPALQSAVPDFSSGPIYIYRKFIRCVLVKNIFLKKNIKIIFLLLLKNH
jgi:hypothetical protein